MPESLKVQSSIIAWKNNNKDDTTNYHLFDNVMDGFTFHDFFEYLANDATYYKNPTQANLNAAFRKFLTDHITTGRLDALWILNNVIPVFLETDETEVIE